MEPQEIKVNLDNQVRLDNKATEVNLVRRDLRVQLVLKDNRELRGLLDKLDKLDLLDLLDRWDSKVFRAPRAEKVELAFPDHLVSLDLPVNLGAQVTQDLADQMEIKGNKDPQDHRRQLGHPVHLVPKDLRVLLDLLDCLETKVKFHYYRTFYFHKMVTWYLRQQKLNYNSLTYSHRKYL